MHTRMQGRHLSMIFLPLLLACTPTGPEPVVVNLRHALQFTGEPNDRQFGYSLAAGSDLDHDGRAEWVVGAPHILGEYTEYQVVRAYEGTTLLTSRYPAHDDRPDEHGMRVSAGHDLDDDGFADAGLSTSASSLITPNRLTLMVSEQEADDLVFELDLDGGDYVYDLVLGDGYVLTNTPRRWDMATPETWGSSQSAVASEATRVDKNDPQASGLGTTSTVDVDGDGVDEFLTGIWWAQPPVSGSTWICPLSLDTQVPEDCELVAEGPGIGGYQIGGDLDGDGIPEIITSEVAANGTHGSASIYRTDGTRLARIEGTRNAMFGRNPTYVVDDRGDPWLLVGQTHLSGDGYPTIWGFRGDQLQGDLVETDALRQWVGGANTMGKAITTYRELPGDPLQLLIGSPGENIVYILPFEPN